MPGLTVRAKICLLRVSNIFPSRKSVDKLNIKGVKDDLSFVREPPWYFVKAYVKEINPLEL